jgi:hypothetical protein
MLGMFKAKPRSRQERRATFRKQVSVPARIFLAGRQLECSTIDLSATGARLAVGMAATLPREFDVWISGGLVLPARLVWRDKKALGVRFV